MRLNKFDLGKKRTCYFPSGTFSSPVSLVAVKLYLFTKPWGRLPGLSGSCPLPSQGSHQKGIVPFSRAEAGDAWQSPGSSSWAGPLAEPKASPFPTPEPREIPTAEKSILAQGLGGALCSYSFPVTGVCIWQEAHGIMHK